MSDFLVREVLPWQGEIWTAWQRHLARGQIPHALLISGAPGLGKGLLALAHAQAALCMEAGEGPCGACKSCQLLESDTHPDLMRIAPEERGKAIRVDRVRALAEFLGTTAQQGGRKAVIIEPAEAMNPSASNALLKSLEEPPGESLLILVSHAPARLAATVRSRCAKRPVAPPSREQALEWLRSRCRGPAEELLDHAGGAPLAALAADEGDKLAEYRAVRDRLLELAQGQTALGPVAEFMAGLEPLEALDQLLATGDQLIRQAAGLRAFGDGAWRQLARQAERRALFRYRDRLLSAKADLLSGTNPNRQLLWEDLLLDWQALHRH